MFVANVFMMTNMPLTGCIASTGVEIEKFAQNDRNCELVCIAAAT